jgi:hypothetical protein
MDIYIIILSWKSGNTIDYHFIVFFHAFCAISISFFVGLFRYIVPGVLKYRN